MPLSNTLTLSSPIEFSHSLFCHSISTISTSYDSSKLQISVRAGLAVQLDRPAGSRPYSRAITWIKDTNDWEVRCAKRERELIYILDGKEWSHQVHFQWVPIGSTIKERECRIEDTCHFRTRKLSFSVYLFSLSPFTLCMIILVLFVPFWVFFLFFIFWFWVVVLAWL